METAGRRIARMKLADRGCRRGFAGEVFGGIDLRKSARSEAESPPTLNEPRGFSSRRQAPVEFLRRNPTQVQF